MLKKYVVCEKITGDESIFYIINTKLNHGFSLCEMIADFDTYEEAEDYINYVQHPEDYFNHDDD